MSAIKRFEDLEIWKLARKISKDFIPYLQNEGFSKDFRLLNQIKGSLGSMMDNIAEGFERGGNKEFVQFLFIAKGSGGEFKSQLHRALDYKYNDEKTFTEFYSSTETFCNKTGSLIHYLQNSGLKGAKFKPQTAEAKTENI